MGGWPFNQQLKSFSGQSTWELGWELLRVCIVLPRKLTWVPPQKIGLFKKESHLPNLELLKFQPLGVFFWECFFKTFIPKTAKPKTTSTCISSIVIPSHLIKLHAARRSWIPWRWPKIWAISSAWKHVKQLVVVTDFWWFFASLFVEKNIQKGKECLGNVGGGGRFSWNT